MSALYPITSLISLLIIKILILTFTFFDWSLSPTSNLSSFLRNSPINPTLLMETFPRESAFTPIIVFAIGCSSYPSKSENRYSGIIVISVFGGSPVIVRSAAPHRLLPPAIRSLNIDPFTIFSDALAVGCILGGCALSSAVARVVVLVCLWAVCCSSDFNSSSVCCCVFCSCVVLTGVSGDCGVCFWESFFREIFSFGKSDFCVPRFKLAIKPCTPFFGANCPPLPPGVPAG